MHRLEHFLCDLVGNVGPNGGHLVFAFHVGHGRVFVLLLKLIYFLASTFDDALLACRRDHIVDTDRHARLGRIQEAHRLKVIEQRNGMLMTEFQMAEAYKRLKSFFLQCSVHEREAVARQAFVKDHAADRCVDYAVFILADGRTHNILSVVLQGQIDQVAFPPQTDL